MRWARVTVSASLLLAMTSPALAEPYRLSGLTAHLYAPAEGRADEEDALDPRRKLWNRIEAGVFLVHVTVAGHVQATLRDHSGRVVSRGRVPLECGE